MNLPLDATGVVQSDDLIKRKRAVKVPVASVYLPIYLPELFWRIITCRVDLLTHTFWVRIHQHHARECGVIRIRKHEYSL